MKNPFGKSFLWGAATSAYQIEGAVDRGGRSPGIWDDFVLKKGAVKDGSGGVDACDHYHRFREDVALIKEMGLTAYRCSISWSRILPKDGGPVNIEGVSFYRSLFRELHEAGIRVMATLYHWDLPRYLEEKGGWTARETARRFADYADVCFEQFGEDVDLWVTINEPSVISVMGYATGEHAPGRRSVKEAMAAAHHLLLAHGLAVQRFRKRKLDSRIGIAHHLLCYRAASLRPADHFAAWKLKTVFNTWFLTACARGQYPFLMKQALKFMHALPVIKPKDMRVISTPCDFLGINYYRRVTVKAGHNPNQLDCVVVDSGPVRTDMGWEIYPEGLYEVCTEAYKLCRLPIYITENGVAWPDKPSADGNVYDSKRIDYLRAHFLEAGRLLTSWVDIRGFFVWSLLDNFEWAEGLSKRFGLVYVDYETQRRIVKESGKWYKKWILWTRDEVSEDEIL